MKFVRFVFSAALFSFASNAFAVCERERAELAEWNSRAEELSAASCVAGAAGGFFAIVTFGASMAPCAALSASAANAHRIKNEKQDNLNICEGNAAREAEASKSAADAAQAAANLAVLREEYIRDCNERDRQNLAIHTDNLNGIYDRMVQDFVAALVAEGWDIADQDTINLINDTRLDLQAQRDREMANFVQMLNNRRANAAHIIW